MRRERDTQQFTDPRDDFSNTLADGRRRIVGTHADELCFVQPVQRQARREAGLGATGGRLVEDEIETDCVFGNLLGGAHES